MITKVAVKTVGNHSHTRYLHTLGSTEQSCKLFLSFLYF